VAPKNIVPEAEDIGVELVKESLDWLTAAVKAHRKKRESAARLVAAIIKEPV